LSAFIIIRGGKLFLMCTEKTIKRFACECWEDKDRNICLRSFLKSFKNIETC
jgi:hypothetical protein